MKTVADILAHKGSYVRTIAPHASIHAAASIMAEHRVGALIVMKDGNPVGLLSERDLVLHVAHAPSDDRGRRVEDVCARYVMGVSPEAELDECMHVMTHRRLRHLPVADGPHLVRIISIGDVVKMLIEDQQFEIEKLGASSAGVPEVGS